MIPPEHIPQDLYDKYTLNNKIPVSNWYFNNTTSTDTDIFYSKKEIEILISEAYAKNTKYYGETDNFLYDALDQYSIIDKSCVIIGSQTPWYESIAIYFGAKLCTTIEYRNVKFVHPKIKTITPKEYKNNPESFDVCLSISSVEHDGLGRYGDPLNPDGDLLAMEQIKHMLHKDSLFFLSVPVGLDKLVWNAHRVYGRIRLPLLLEGWKILSTFGFKEDYLDSYDNIYRYIQPIFVLQKNS